MRWPGIELSSGPVAARIAAVVLVGLGVFGAVRAVVNLLGY
jgi:hypothetical protein